jgi:hypothetical protein
MSVVAFVDALGRTLGRKLSLKKIKGRSIGFPFMARQAHSFFRRARVDVVRCSTRSLLE